MRAVPVRQGDLLAGRYRVDGVLGAGAMGFVVAATDVEQQQRRALKLMLPGALQNREAVERFLREARASSCLRGDHVTHVHEVGSLDDGAPFLVMEYLEGHDLAALLEKRVSIPLDPALPLGLAVTILLQVCEALAEAHANGVVHRDLKPANLFLVKRPHGEVFVKVLDFGVSKILGDAATTDDVTSSYAMLGSPHYMSPEQMRSSRDVDARTDVWSLGVIAYQLITGRLPFEGKRLTQIVHTVLQGKPTPPSAVLPGLPPALEAAILACLEDDLDKRCPGVVELAASLAPFAPPEAAGSLKRLGIAPPARGPPTAPVIAGMVAALALGGGLAFLLFRFLFPSP
jgi:eukaryotic-like serine/threonine-protein kinase